MARDKTADAIFSSRIETWRNLGGRIVNYVNMRK